MTIDLLAILVNSLWAGLFSGCFGFILTAPTRYVVPAFASGFAGRFVLGALMAWGINQNWSTVVAALAVVLVSVALIRREEVSPVVLITGVLPLGASFAMFNVILGLLKVSSLTGDMLTRESALLSANLGKVITTSMAIALGLATGMAIVGLFRRENSEKYLPAE